MGILNLLSKLPQFASLRIHYTKNSKRNLAVSGPPKPCQYLSSWFDQKSHPTQNLSLQSTAENNTSYKSVGFHRWKSFTGKIPEDPVKHKYSQYIIKSNQFCFMNGVWGWPGSPNTTAINFCGWEGMKSLVWPPLSRCSAPHPSQRHQELALHSFKAAHKTETGGKITTCCMFHNEKQNSS